jgi:hypothetical protein
MLQNQVALFLDGTLCGTCLKLFVPTSVFDAVNIPKKKFSSKLIKNRINISFKNLLFWPSLSGFGRASPNPRSCPKSSGGSQGR